MSWVFFAILARFLWACTNFVDQYTVRISGHNSPLAFVIIVYILLFPIPVGLALFYGSPLAVHPASLIWIGAGAVLCMLSLFPYLMAIKSDAAHNVIPLFEMIPVFVTLLAYILFGDKLGGRQLAGAALVLTGGFFFSWDFKHGHIRLRTLLLMAAASFGYAFYQLSLRYGAASEPVWLVVFWLGTGLSVTASIIFIVAGKARRLFFDSVRRTKGKILAVAFIQNLTDFAATASLTAAFAQAPGAGYVAALSGTQSIFIFIISLVLGRFYPRHYVRLEWDHDMKIKCCLLAVMVGGIVLLKS